MSVHFFVALLLFIAGLVYIAHIVAKYAQSKGLSYAPIFALGLVTSPVIQFIVVLIMESNIDKTSIEHFDYSINKTCPFCAESIKAEAIVCRFCNRDQPAYIAPAETAAISKPEIEIIYPYECPRCGNRYKDETSGCAECKLIC